MENKPTNQSAQTQIHEAKPVGYLFNGRFYKSLDELRGRTMSEDNEPIALYTLTASSGERVDGWHPRYKHDDDERFVFQIDTGENRGKWFYSYRDGNGKNQYSKVFQTKAEAVKEYNLLPLFTTSSLPNLPTKQSVNSPAQEEGTALKFSLEDMMQFGLGVRNNADRDSVSKLLNDYVIHQGKYFTYIPLQTKGREVEFAEWILKSYWKKAEDAWEKRAGNYVYGILEEVKSSQQLFQLFLTTNPSNKGE